MGGDRVILIVEDDVAIRATIADYLASEGYLVDEAADGAEGLGSVARRRPHLIVLDFHMPVMGGRRFLDALRGRPDTRDIPVVLMTGAVLAAPAAEGADAVLLKPFQLDDLASAVRRFAGPA